MSSKKSGDWKEWFMNRETFEKAIGPARDTLTRVALGAVKCSTDWPKSHLSWYQLIYVWYLIIRLKEFNELERLGWKRLK